MQAFLDCEFGKYISVFIISMTPVLELRGSIPFGVAKGLPLFPTTVISVFGNMVPVPFIILFVRKIFEWFKRYSKLMGGLVVKLEKRAENKSKIVRDYQMIGLCILVAIPLPGTGAWTGALVAAILELRLKHAVPSIFAGVVIAGIFVAGISAGIFTWIKL